MQVQATLLKTFAKIQTSSKCVDVNDGAFKLEKEKIRFPQRALFVGTSRGFFVTTNDVINDILALCQAL